MNREDKDLLLHMAAIKAHCARNPYCFGCRMVMEPEHSACFFQLGKRPSDWTEEVIAASVEDIKPEEVKPRFRNWYKCDHCKTDWNDVWDSMCDDRCPVCGIALSPYYSEEIQEKEGDTQ